MFFAKTQELTAKAAVPVKTPVVYLIIIAVCAVMTLLMVIVPSIFIALSKNAVTINPFGFIK